MREVGGELHAAKGGNGVKHWWWGGGTRSEARKRLREFYEEQGIDLTQKGNSKMVDKAMKAITIVSVCALLVGLGWKTQ